MLDTPCFWNKNACTEMADSLCTVARDTDCEAFFTTFASQHQPPRLISTAHNLAYTLFLLCFLPDLAAIFDETPANSMAFVIPPRSGGLENRDHINLLLPFLPAHQSRPWVSPKSKTSSRCPGAAVVQLHLGALGFTPFNMALRAPHARPVQLEHCPRAAAAPVVCGVPLHELLLLRAAAGGGFLVLGCGASLPWQSARPACLEEAQGNHAIYTEEQFSMVFALISWFKRSGTLGRGTAAIAVGRAGSAVR